MSIRFFEIETKSQLKNKKLLKSFILQCIEEYFDLKKTEITYIFCNDDYLLQKNIQFLNHDTFTDILTFDLSENETELVAEIYISIDRIKDNASKFNTTYQQELHRVIFHGLLHLLGFDDTSKEKKSIMKIKEDEFLEAYAIITQP